MKMCGRSGEQMNKTQFIVAWAMGILLLSGCATIGSINKHVGQVNPSDGISKQEAKWIAQKYCVEAVC